MSYGGHKAEVAQFIDHEILMTVKLISHEDQGAKAAKVIHRKQLFKWKVTV